MRMITILLLATVIVAGCATDNCFDDCIDTYKSNDIQNSTVCIGDSVCYTPITSELKEICFDKCYQEGN